ncbi:hypothetical protein DYB34_012685 [Aphanomyces astaci]|uniref:Gram-positive cocci surface proteins LPxTG domain-containing protein n=1 Tax=Aphanomyces astaci TaxID=112090 RepID=A0A3R6W7Y2_APHAT|nr:hypothetical protein DYB34_012685 [Aphanomyces astaci]
MGLYTLDPFKLVVIFVIGFLSPDTPCAKHCPAAFGKTGRTRAPTTTTSTSPPTTTTSPSTSTASLAPSTTSSSTSDITTNNTTPDAPPEKGTSWGNAPYFIAGGVALVALGMLVIILVRKSRRPDDDDDNDVHALHLEQHTKQITNEPTTAYVIPASVAFPYTPTSHQVDPHSKHNGSLHQQPMSSPYGGMRATNESFVRPRLPSGPVDPPFRLPTVDPPQDYRALEAERGSVTF